MEPRLFQIPMAALPEHVHPDEFFLVPGGYLAVHETGLNLAAVMQRFDPRHLVTISTIDFGDTIIVHARDTHLVLKRQAAFHRVMRRLGIDHVNMSDLIKRFRLDELRAAVTRELQGDAEEATA